MTDILPESEIDFLTKPLTQRAAQARVLEKMLGCKIERRPDGLPVVHRDMLARLCGEKPKQPQPTSGINWSK